MSPSAPSANGHETFKTTAEDETAPATATDAYQHNAASEPVDGGERFNNADAADGARHASLPQHPRQQQEITK
jgi:hypothetical protein